LFIRTKEYAVAYVQTTTGISVNGKGLDGKPDAYTLEQAQASVADRNQRAEELGIKTRYEVAGE
jgi:hypothetical protein